MNEKKAPFQISNFSLSWAERNYRKKHIKWEAHVKAYEKYAEQYGRSQSAERIAERGGFGDCELDEFFPEWRNFIID